MIVCICKNINEAKITKELEGGSSVKSIIQKFDCLQCKKCIKYIYNMHKEHNQEENTK